MRMPCAPISAPRRRLRIVSGVLVRKLPIECGVFRRSSCCDQTARMSPVRRMLIGAHQQVSHLMGDGTPQQAHSIGVGPSASAAMRWANTFAIVPVDVPRSIRENPSDRRWFRAWASVAGTTCRMTSPGPGGRWQAGASGPASGRHPDHDTAIQPLQEFRPPDGERH